MENIEKLKNWIQERIDYNESMIDYLCQSASANIGDLLISKEREKFIYEEVLAKIMEIEKYEQHNRTSEEMEEEGR